MHSLLKAGAVALALSGFALAPSAPAQAATYLHPAPHVTVRLGPAHPRWHRVKVCTSTWHHHHRVTTCTWVNKRWM